MRKTLQWVHAALLSVLAITVVSNLVKPTPWFSGELGDLSADVSLASEDNPVDTAAEVALVALWPRQNDTISFSTQAEVARFTLKGEGAFTLRYVTLSIQSTGLKPIQNWTIYEVNESGIDFKNPVGYAEKMDSELLKIRLFSSPSSAYLCEDGEQTFALVAEVLSDSDPTTSSSLTLSFPSSLPSELDWAWLPGVYAEPWINVSESLGVSELSELSELPLTKL